MANKIFNLNYLPLNFLLIIFVVNLNPIDCHYANTKEYLVEEEASDNILCRLCGADLTESKHIINHLSPKATVKTNQTLFGRTGVEVQLLENPLGIKFQLITVSDSKCVAVHNWQHDFSWYPGFAWKPCICKQCRTHHGWLFEPNETANLSSNLPTAKGFFALNLHGLLSENCQLVNCYVPKSYLNWKMMELTVEQEQFLKECEEEFKDRYSEKDDDFIKVKSADPKVPPIIDPWPNTHQRSNNWSRQTERGWESHQNWRRRHGRDRHRDRARGRSRDRDTDRSRERDRGGERERDSDRDRDRDRGGRDGHAGRHHFHAQTYRPY